MNLGRAMTDLSIQLEVKRQLGQPHQADAIKLGIEALKIVGFTRANNFRLPLGLLPGETED